ncbi:hypothetical protein [Citrobacter amalonaticus]|uniref:hypothetical protein n=1 Tax=Citrobacter amalonaticus TaxID=35703 RepID=UPI0019075E1C|nr:hypothetical protein [Citrobacter amalonaticus]MBJ9260313.1 hypothetical protein [Citrobacter amalonaticus]HAU5637980.1 hypothetical protein [Citrobacter amalonaticus]HDQ2813429.1 hypothetical protein [Citrobacter amalonaticus]
MKTITPPSKNKAYYSKDKNVFIREKKNNNSIVNEVFKKSTTNVIGNIVLPCSRRMLPSVFENYFLEMYFDSKKNPVIPRTTLNPENNRCVRMPVSGIQ